MTHKHLLRIMILIETSRAFDRNLIRGITHYANTYGPWETYRIPPAYCDPYGKDTALMMADDWGADGIILRETQGFANKIPGNIPVVISSESEEEISGCGNIVGDHNGIGRMAAKHLIDLGFKNYAYCGFDHMYWSRLRCEGFCAAVKEAGYEVKIYKQPPIASGLLWEKEQPFLEEWLKSLPSPAGLMACADERSEQVLQACKTTNRRVPDDIAIIGADNDELICDLCYPNLSSVAFNSEAAGFKALLC